MCSIKLFAKYLFNFNKFGEYIWLTKEYLHNFGNPIFMPPKELQEAY